MKIENKGIEEFILELEENEYSIKTIEKYKTDIKKLRDFLDGKEVEKTDIIAYKEKLCETYKPRSVNSILAACNRFFTYLERGDLKVKQLKIQQEVFCPEEKELTKKEYKNLVYAAKNAGKIKIALMMQTLCSTGIRVSELEFITVFAIKKGKAEVRLKGKNRTILIHEELRTKLLYYIAKEKIQQGPVFVTKSGKPCNRSNIWKEMKGMAQMAQVCLQKVFPHNLRHLFAREFYKIKKDIVQLADVLGHSNINTTRIYMLSTGREHRKTLRKMKLII